MSLRSVLMLLGICAAGMAADYAVSPAEYQRILENSRPRMIKTADRGTIPLVRNGQPVFNIVISGKSSQVVRFAAEEIQRFARTSSGAAAKIVNAPVSGMTSLYLGDQPAVRKAGIVPENLPRDGFQLIARGGDIFLAGRDDPRARMNIASWGLYYERGTLNGVYVFLEKFFGDRFYFPGEIGTVLPVHKDLLLPEMSILDRPDYTRRRTLYGNAKWFPEVSAEEQARYMYTLRMETFYVPVCHSLERLKYADRFGKTHPEYIAMDEKGNRYLNRNLSIYGNICFSNPGLKNEVYQDARAYLTGQPSSSRGLKIWDPSICRKGFFNIMPKDHFRHCMCADCRKFYEKNPKDDLVWNLTCYVGNRLIQEKIPGYITALAYGHYTRVPDMPLPKNLLMMVSVRGPWAYGTPAEKKHDDRILAWKKKTGRKPWLWAAVYKYGGLDLPSIPPMTPLAVGRYYTSHKDMISGSFMEAETDHLILSYLNYYFLSRCSWDNDMDYKKALQEHHKLMFGKGAAPMAKFYQAIEDIWMKKIAGRIVETNLGSQAIPPSDYELWEKIYSPAQLKEFSQWFDQAAALAKGDAMSVRRIEYFRKHFLGLIQQGQKKYFDIRQGVAQWKYNATSLKAGESIAVDGSLDEAAWKNVKASYLLPWRQELSEVNTSFKVRFDEKNLYFAVDSREPHMDKVIAQCVKRDDPNLWAESVIELFLNPSGNNRDYHHFIINSKGVLYDAENQRLGKDSSSNMKWNTGAVMAVKRHAGGWYLEIAMPKAELKGFNPEKFVFNIARHRVVGAPTKTKLYSWSPFIKGFHDLENFGRLTFDAASGAELLMNGDFTEKARGRYFGGWWGDHNDVVKGFVGYDTRYFRSGGQSFRMTNDGTRRRVITQWLPKLKPNTEYLLTYDIRMEKIAKGAVYLNLCVLHNIFLPKNGYYGTMPWTSQGFRFKTRDFPNKRQPAIRLQFFPGTGTVWLDNVKITEVKK